MPLSISKCVFGQNQVEYLGYRVDTNGIKPLQHKLQALYEFKQPKTQKDLLHFLGAINYYRSSLKGLIIQGQFKNTAAILQPLYSAGTAKLEKVSFEDVWSASPALKIAFKQAKQLLINAVELIHPNPNWATAICVDASDHSVGASLEMQDPVTKQWLPLGFFSKHLTPTQKKYSVFKKELLAAHYSVRHFLTDIQGKECTIFSDHLPLCQAMDSDKIPLHDPQTYRQLMEIAQFTRDIRHVSGKFNVVADWFSRGGSSDSKSGDVYNDIAPLQEIAVTETSQIQGVSIEALASLQNCDEIKKCKEGQYPKRFKFDTVNFRNSGIDLFCEISSEHGPRPYIPKSLASQIIQSIHHLDHKSTKTTKQRISSQYFWPTLKQDIEKYVKGCHICKQTKTSKSLVNTGVFEVPDRRMSHIMVDIVGPLPTSHNGYKYLLTCLDRCTRIMTALPIKQATAGECSTAFLHGWVKLYGLPSLVTSDRGSNFTASLWQNMLADLNIEIKHSAMYRPQSMGMLERSHGPLKQSLKAALLENADFHQEKWIDHLPWILLGKNSAYQEDIKASPFQLLYGFCPTLPGQILDASNNTESTKELEQLLLNQQKRVSMPAVQPSSHKPPERPLPGLPEGITHVYTKQHKAIGLQPPYAGPFPLVERLSNSTIKIKVGHRVNGDPIYEVRHLNDIKLSHPDSNVTNATRPKRGRPSAMSDPSPTPDASTVALISQINFSTPPPSAEPRHWSASVQELEAINQSIEGKSLVSAREQKTT